jgi:RNA polymerase sigma-70 factor, ECF subfamily
VYYSYDIDDIEFMNSQELELVQKAQGGDRQALGQLWDLITPKLFGYLINTLRDKTLAEDILQATWLKAINALSKFEPREVSISAWLFAIARNECKLHWRKGDREVELNVDLLDESHPHNDSSENKILIEQILNKLSVEDRELLQLRYIADLSPNEIAKILNINFVAVRVRLHRAIKRAQSII